MTRARRNRASLAGLLLVCAACVPARAVAQASDSPLEISADNVSGTHGPEGDAVLLKGDVRIVRGRTVITADLGRYLRGQGRLFLDEHVKMVDSTLTVTCDHVVYSELNDVLDLSGNVVIVDRDATLRAPAGSYDRRTGRAHLFGGVSGVEKGRDLTADHAVYWRDSLLLQARGHVRGADDAHHLVLEGDAVDYDRGTDLAVATGAPRLRSKDDDGVITELRADTLRVNTRTRVAEAVDSVHVVRDSLRASADYARFDDVAERGILLGHPEVRDDQTRVTGDTLEVLTEKRVLKQVIVRSNAVMDYAGARPQTVGEATRLYGDRVDVFFTHEDIDSLVAVGSARNEYRATPREGQTAERNQATGDTITIFFKDRKVERARVEGGAQGEYHMAVDAADTVAARREIVTYSARQITFEVPKSQIVLDGKSHLEYRDMKLESRRVEFDVNKQTLVAEGDPQLMERGDEVTGHLMTYDLDTRVGTIYKAETTYERGLYHGGQIRKVSENELDVLNGSYTTCDLAEPHYHFAAHWMKIYLKDKLVAKPVVFYVKNVPLLALPFWVFPIKPGRHSGFLFPQFELGFNNRAGQFIRNAGYYWATNDYMDFTVAGDYYRAQPSWQLRGEGRYNLLYVLDGDINTAFARNELSQRDDWSLEANHRQNLDPNTRLVGRAQFISSRDFSTSNDYGRTLEQRLNRFLTSSIAVSRTSSWASWNLILDRRQDLDADQAIKDPTLPIGTPASLSNLTQNEPTLSLSFPTRQIGSLGFLKGTPLEKPLASIYATLSSRFVSLRQQRGLISGRNYFTTDGQPDSSNVLTQRVSVRRALSNDISISDSRRLFGWLNLVPRFSSKVVVFDFDELGHKVVPTGTWSSGLTASSTFYGTFLPRWGAVEGIRHVVFPSASFSYSPDFPNLIYTDEFGGRRSRFSNFGGIGVSGFKSASMSFALDQRFQVKLRHGQDVQRLDNLLSWSTSGSYNFLWKERGLEHPLSTIGSSIRIQPPRLLNVTFGWTTDVYQPHPVRSMGLSTGLNLASSGAQQGQGGELPVDGRERESSFSGDQWSLSAAYSLAGGYVGTKWRNQQTANGVITYQLSPGWALDWSASYDITQRIMQTQRFSLSRDLHCWQMSFTRTFIAGGEAEYYFRISIKEQREIYYERGTRAGSIGGIQ